MSGVSPEVLTDQWISTDKGQHFVFCCAVLHFCSISKPDGCQLLDSAKMFDSVVIGVILRIVAHQCAPTCTNASA